MGASCLWNIDRPGRRHTALSRKSPGLDDASDTSTQLNADARGVYRVYQMSLDDGVWKLWRNAPGFSQRFKGTFSDDGQTITGAWEYSSDGSTWEHDFDLTYTKVG